MKIVDYGLLSAGTQDTDDPCEFLTEMVARTIADGDGWQPFGSVTAYTDNGATVLVQAMVKYEEPQTLNAPGDRP